MGLTAGALLLPQARVATTIAAAWALPTVGVSAAAGMTCGVLGTATSIALDLVE